VEVAAAHFDNRTETAVVGAAPRRFDNVDGPAEERVAVEHAGATVGQRQEAILQPAHWPRRRMPERARDRGGETERESWDGRHVAAALECLQQRPKRQLAFPADDEVDAAVGGLICVRRQARIVAPGHHGYRRLDGADETNQPERGSPLERHHRQADHVGILLAHQPFDRWNDRILNEDEIGGRDAVTPARVASERRQRPIRHAHRQRGRMLERVRHREEENPHRGEASLHRPAPTFPGDLPP
jgi:hypothetical protein